MLEQAQGFIGKTVKISRPDDPDVAPKTIRVIGITGSAFMRKDILYYLDGGGESIPIGWDTEIIVIKEDSTE